MIIIIRYSKLTMMKVTAAVLVSILLVTETNSFAPSNLLQQHQTSASLLDTETNAFAPSSSLQQHQTYVSRDAFLMATRPDSNNNFDSQDDSTTTSIDRRSYFLATTAIVGSLLTPASAQADEPTKATESTSQTVVVAGATGQTGRRILERLAGQPGLTVIGGVRNIDKASKTLSESSTVVRGAMVQKVGSVDTAGVDLKRIDVVEDSVDVIAASLAGATGLVIATGFIPGNPLKMSAEAHKVDNVGTIRLIDAAKKAGVQKVVMVSSILTNGRNWGQEKSPGFVITNAFGQVLDEKIVAENYLRASGLDYTIVRPGGLKAKPPTGGLKISGEDTLNSGEISRDLVADVCVASLTDVKAKNQVLEIIEDDGTPPKVFNGLNM